MPKSVLNDRSLLLAIAARVFLFAALAYLVLSLAWYGLPGKMETSAFTLLKGIHMLPPFADLRWATSLSECGIDLQALADRRLCGCDPYLKCSGLGYPPMSIEIARFLGVQGRHTGLIGFAMGLSVVVIVVAQVRRLVKLPWLRDLFTGSVLLSFPLQMGLERSNIDLVIFILLTSLSAALASFRLWPLPLAAALAWVLVAIKVYPLVGILAWVGQSLLWRPRLDWLRGATLAGALAGLASVFPWLLNYGKGAAQPGAGLVSHAFRVSLPYSPRLSTSVPVVYDLIYSFAQPLLGFGLFVVALTFSLQSGLSGRWMSMLDQTFFGFERRFLQIFPGLLGCVWLGCFFFSSNYDYRLILVFPAYIACFSIWITKRHETGRFKLLFDVVMYGLFAAFLGPLLITSQLLRPPFDMIEVLLDKLCDLFILPLFAGVVASLLIPPVSIRLARHSS